MRRFALTVFVSVLFGSLPVLAQDHGGHEGGHEAVAAEGEHGAEHGAAHHGVSAHDLATKEFVGSVINFAILLGLLVYFGRSKISAYLVERRREIAEALDEAQRLKREAEAKHAEYTSRLAKLDSELEKIRQDMVKAGEAERDRIIAEAEKKAERIRHEGRFALQQRSKAMRDDLLKEAVELAIDAAEKVLVEKTTAEDQQRLSRAYLERMNTALKENRS